MTIAHNISINVTDADSPAGPRRRIHLRSLSDVTPRSDRPAPPPAAAAAAAALQPRAVCSARTSPAASRERLDDLQAGAVSVLGDPWRKMSELDLRTAARSTARQSLDGSRVLDPWVKNSTARSAADATRDRVARDDTSRPNVDEPKRDGTFRRGKLERKAAVVCESCGNESCECWRPRSPGCPRTPRAARALSATARCTCERSPRVSPARLAPRQPVRALSDDEARPRRLYKSSSQKMICTSMEGESVKKAADPLLETTC